MSDQALLERASIVADRVMAFALDLRRQGFEVSITVSWSTNVETHDVRIEAPVPKPKDCLS